MIRQLLLIPVFDSLTYTDFLTFQRT